MLDWSSCPAVERSPDKVSGAWVFRGTRVPVKALFENLEDSASVDEFLEWFPDVTKDQVDAVLEHASRSLELAGLKILFDQGVPVPLRKHLTEHQVFTAFEKTWNDLKNGELLQKAEEEGFDALVTTDQNLRYQQNLQERKIAVVVLMSTSGPKIQKAVLNVEEAINTISVGDYLEIVISDTEKTEGSALGFARALHTLTLGISGWLEVFSSHFHPLARVFSKEARAISLGKNSDRA